MIEEEAKEEEQAWDGRSSHKKQQQVQVNLRFRKPEAQPLPLISEFDGDKKFIFPPTSEEEQRRDPLLEVSDEIT